MGLVIVTGMSGAGKSTALHTFEDMGYFCMDNLPISLLPQLVELLRDPSKAAKKTALGLDVRSGTDNRKALESFLDSMKVSDFSLEILFLDCSDEVLLRRFKETRRKHPLAIGGRNADGIKKEREEIRFLRERAHFYLDTSRTLVRNLNTKIQNTFSNVERYVKLQVTILSFGFKYGLPSDADLVFDVRFLPNPYYVQELRHLTGNDEPVRDFVMENEKAKQFVERFTDMIAFLLPNYVIEGKTQLVIAVGCTGGKHRSVTLANALQKFLQKYEEYNVIQEHRDIER